MGSDILDAMEEVKLRGAKLAIIIAGDKTTDLQISPNGGSMATFERFQKKVLELGNIIDFPLVLGKLTMDEEEVG